MRAVIDMTGQIFGTIIVIDRNLKQDKNKNAYWNCKCLKCGRLHVVAGCYLREKKTYCCSKCSNPTRTNDSTGQQYGNWLVIDKDTIKNHTQYYFCKCLKCDNVFSVNGKNLRNGNTTQCLSCSKKNQRSKGEQYIYQILIDNNIDFQEEYFQLIKNRKLFFDFVIFNALHQIIKVIEFDGDQHYNRNNPWYSEDMTLRDKLKNEWCKNNNIILLRYRDIKEIQTKDLIN